MKKFIKNIILLLFLVIIIGGIGAGIYFFSPEVKPGEVGLLYKVVGSDKGFTGKILPPGKYYAFITDFKPVINKIYKLNLHVKNLNVKYLSDDGVNFDLNLVYGIDEKNIDNFVKKIKMSEVDDTIKVFVKSDIKEILAGFPINDIFQKDFQSNFNNMLLKSLNKDLSFFGINVSKLFINKMNVSNSLKNIYNTIKEKEKELAILKIQTEQKLKEAKLKNKIKEENLNFLLKKAEAEKQIVKAKIEAEKLVRQFDKERMLEEVEIFNKPGGALAAKLEAVRILSKAKGNAENIINKLDKVFEK